MDKYQYITYRNQTNCIGKSSEVGGVNKVMEIIKS